MNTLFLCTQTDTHTWSHIVTCRCGFRMVSSQKALLSLLSHTQRLSLLTHKLIQTHTERHIGHTLSQTYTDAHTHTHTHTHTDAHTQMHTHAHAHTGAHAHRRA